MKHLLALFCIAVTLTVLGAAQDRAGRRAERMEAIQDLRSDLRSWFERDVYPTAKIWHEQYDASLTSDDLSDLKRLRAEAKRLREAVTTDLKSIRASAESGSRSSMREKLQDIREKYRGDLEDLLERLKPIAKRSRTMLRKLFDDNEDKIEAWRSQARNIVGDWREEHDDLSMKGMFGRGDHQLPLLAGDGRKAAVRFILWDGTMPPAPEPRLPAPQQRMPMNVSPAPSGNTATVSAMNVPDGQHMLQVYDMNGTLIRSTAVTSVSGKVTQNIDLSGIPAGTYMVSVNTPAGRSTTNLVINK
jgi:F0F1-type ATP synthase membrane subunit b/b'